MIVSAEGVKKSYGERAVLCGVSFIIEKGDTVAFVGVNGSGKSTLFDMLAGVSEADGGIISIAKDVSSVSYLAQRGDTLSGELTAREEMTGVFKHLIELEDKIRRKESEISEESQSGKCADRLLREYQALIDSFEENGGYSYKSLIRGVIAGLRLDNGLADRKIKTLSGGQKTRAALGRALLLKPDILLLDEPTSNLDINTVKWLEGYLKAYEKTVLFISHDRYFIDFVANKVIELEDGFAKCFKAKRKAYTEYIERKGSAGFSKKYAMRLNLESSKESGYDVLLVENVCKAYKTPVLNNVSFELKKGERVAVIGENGVGKTTLLRIIMKELSQDYGTVRIGANVKAGYYDQERQKIDASLTVIEQVREYFPKMKDGEIRNTLAAFLFRGDDVFKQISALSGGERGRLCFALIMLSGANFLVLDEPTNDLDIYSKEILENALADFSGTCLFVSHDRYFINKTATKILELTENGITSYMGDYDYYLQKKAENEENAQYLTQPRDSREDNKRLRDIKKNAQLFERRRVSLIKKIERKISELEQAIADCEALLNDEAICSDALLTNEYYEKKLRLEDELLTLYEEYAEKSE